MDKKSLSYLAVVVVVALTAGGIMWSLARTSSVWHEVNTPPPHVQPSAKEDRVFQNDIYHLKMTVPTGWYMHERIDGLAILTKKERLTFPQGNDTWSVGEQIMTTVEDMTVTVGNKPTPEKWVAKNVPDKDASDQVVKKNWEEINGNRMLRVEQMPAGATSQSLTYYAFRKNNVFRFTLYPFDPANQTLGGNLSDFTKLVSSVTFTDSLETKKN